MAATGQSATLTRVVKHSSPTRGYSYTEIWECVSASAAQSKYLDLVFQGGEVVWSDGAKHVLEATFGGEADAAEVPTDSFEYDEDVQQKDFLEADHDLVNVLVTAHRDQLSRAMEDPKTFGGFSNESNAASLNAANYLWSLFNSGFRHIEVRAPILRLNRLQSQGYSVLFTFSGVGRILSTETMLSDAGAIHPYTQAARLIGAFYGSAPTRSDDLVLAYGWKKGSPKVSQGANNKVVIQQEYKFGLWDTYLFKDVI